MVSICMITYNHEKFIAEAIEGVLMQNVNFPIELIIGDDASNDGTQSIILEYQKKYPELIKYFRNETNVGMLRNFTNSLNRCKKKYIALCEGDDYWTDENKLQIQVDFLDKHQDYIMCFTDVEFYNMENSKRKISIRSDKTTLTTFDLISKNEVSTLTTVFRNIPLKLSAAYLNLKIGDWPLYLMLSQNGLIKRIEKVTGVYRIHSGNVYAGISQLNRKLEFLKLFEFLIHSMNAKYLPVLKNKLNNLYYTTGDEYLSINNRTEALIHYKQMKLICNSKLNLKKIKLGTKILIKT